MKFRIRRSDDILGFLDEGISMSGELHFKGQLRIDGNFTGSIFTDELLVIGRKAVIRADIHAGSITIAGEVYGNIEAKQRAEILPGGRVYGEIRSPILVMSAGSILDGRTYVSGEASSS